MGCDGFNGGFGEEYYSIGEEEEKITVEFGGARRVGTVFESCPDCFEIHMGSDHVLVLVPVTLQLFQKQFVS